MITIANPRRSWNESLCKIMWWNKLHFWERESRKWKFSRFTCVSQPRRSSAIKFNLVFWNNSFPEVVNDHTKKEPLQPGKRNRGREARERSLGKFGYLCIREILVITWRYARPSFRLQHRYTNNSINRYDTTGNSRCFWREIAWPPGLLEKKNSNNFSTLFLMSRLITWITEIDLERVIKSKGN